MLCALLCRPGLARAGEADVGLGDSGIKSVFFVTDREPKPGKVLKFGAQLNAPVDHLVYGMTAADKRTSSTANVTHPGFREFSEDLHQALRASGKGGIVIFVHGCCVSFREAIKQAAELQSQVKMPVLAYDWGTPTFGYSGSLLACPRTQERFNSLMLQVAREFPHERIALVGVSMGAILIDSFLLQHRPSEVGRRFDQVVFARADMDSIAFQTHIPRISEHAGKLYVFAGKNDLLINISHILRSIASPAFRGDRVGRLSQRLPKDKLLKVIDVSPLNMNHRLPCAVVADLLACQDTPVPHGQYRYIELPDGIWRVEPP